MDKVLITSTGVNSITTNPCYGFVATTSGLDIFDLDSRKNIAYAMVSGGVSDVYVPPYRCEDVDLLLGTTLSGVLSMPLTAETTGDSTSSLSGVFSHPTLPSNKVTCLDVGISGFIGIGTASGICLITPTGGVYSHTYSVETTSCALTPSGDLYYSPANSGLYVKFSPISSDWSAPDYILDVSSTPALSGNRINDIELAYHSVSGNYHVFLATNSGMARYIEDRNTVTSSYMILEDLTVYGGINNVTSIELHEGSLVTSGALTLATGDLNFNGIIGVYDLISGSIISTYTDVSFESTSGTLKAISGTEVVHRVV